MNLRQLQHTRHSKPERSAHDQPDNAPQQKPLHRSIVQLQSVIGNQAVQRMIDGDALRQLIGGSTAHDQQQTDGNSGGLIGGMIKSILENSADTQQQTNGNSGGFTGIGNIIKNLVNQQSRFAGDEEFHAKARPKNQYYANNPPTPGWPYTDQLRALWEAGSFNEFANEVATYQRDTLKLPEPQVDGILGPKTSRRLSESQSGAQTPAPAAQTPAADGTQTPAADSTQTPAPSSESDTSATTTTPTSTTAFPVPDDSVASVHPVATRILGPVKQAFADYKAAEKEYQAADRAVGKAKADKAVKEEERQKEMGEMEASRANARAIMATARAQVAALTASDFTSPAEMKQVIGYINRQLNTNTIYYTQMQNADILFGNGLTAAWRTCNMTVISMMLEALGKSSKDYTGDMTKLQNIAGEFDKQLGINNSNPGDLTSLRLPDFLQLVAIDMTGSRENAAKNITSHAFITDVVRRFGLKVVDIKGNERMNKGEHERSFMGNKLSGKLSSIGVLYRPAESKGRTALAADEGYKDKELKGKAKEEYAKKFMADFTESMRLKYIQNTEDWKAIDTQAKTQLEVLQAEFDKPNATDASQPRVFDAEFQAKADEVLKGLQDILAAIPKEHEGRQKQIKQIIKTLTNAIKADRRKADKPPKNLAALFDGKGNNDPIKLLEANFKKYEASKAFYENLGKEGGLEETVPMDEYKATIIPTMQQAIESGFQVMVNLDNHFVRLQSVADDGFVIDDPGNTYGEDNKITWEVGRKHGYFQHYLLISQ